MQCARCFFENPADARWCGYCGHAFASEPAESAPDAGSPAQKRATRLGGVPEDPFAPVAASLRGGAAAPVAPPRPPTPPRARRTFAPEPDPAAAPARPVRPKRRAHQATIVDGVLPETPDRAEIIGMVLVLPADGGEPRTEVLRAGQRRIGREADNDIVLDDPRASATHAILRAEPDDVWLLDTSTNGTVVNGVRIRADRARIADGAVIEVGRTLVAVQIFAEDTLGILRSARR